MEKPCKASSKYIQVLVCQSYKAARLLDVPKIGAYWCLGRLTSSVGVKEASVVPARLLLKARLPSQRAAKQIVLL